jgi:phosphatidate cytidylyltransferase
MLIDRLGISILLIPLAVWVIWLGGPLYLLAVLVAFALAVREYVRLFRSGGQRPAQPVIVAGTLLLIAARQFPVLNLEGGLFVALIVAALIWHLADYELGASTSGTDFVITLGGVVYLGGLGGYFVAVRGLPHGFWWTALIFSSIWLADTGAYAAGRTLGRHKMAPRLSPKKTWEGFVGGVLGGALCSGLLSIFWGFGAGPESLLNWQTGALIGGLTGLVGPIGDLGISMLKRQTGVKDSGDVIAGHGGVLDRIDSWLIAAPVGYYVVLLIQTSTR